MFFPEAAWSFFMSSRTPELLLMREQFVFRLVFTVKVKTRLETFPGFDRSANDQCGIVGFCEGSSLSSPPSH